MIEFRPFSSSGEIEESIWLWYTVYATAIYPAFYLILKYSVSVS